VPSCLARRPRTASIEEADFLLTKTRRAAIHARDRGLCFYCLTQLTPRTRCLDHVIPLARRGKNSYRNLISCCTECNTQKGETAAEDFLRTLCRQRRITSAELADRLRKLDALAAGELRPAAASPQLPQ
jgi:5-methylcytosine-specific restriction endonuclease McrA